MEKGSLVRQQLMLPDSSKVVRQEERESMAHDCLEDTAEKEYSSREEFHELVTDSQAKERDRDHHTKKSLTICILKARKSKGCFLEKQQQTAECINTVSTMKQHDSSDDLFTADKVRPANKLKKIMAQCFQVNTVQLAAHLLFVVEDRAVCVERECVTPDIQKTRKLRGQTFMEEFGQIVMEYAGGDESSRLDNEIHPCDNANV